MCRFLLLWNKKLLLWCLGRREKGEPWKGNYIQRSVTSRKSNCFPAFSLQSLVLLRQLMVDSQDNTFVLM